jgi:hypothetical protein
VRVRLVLTSKGAGASNSGTQVIKATLKKK